MFNTIYYVFYITAQMSNIAAIILNRNWPHVIFLTFIPVCICITLAAMVFSAVKLHKFGQTTLSIDTLLQNRLALRQTSSRTGQTPRRKSFAISVRSVISTSGRQLSNFVPPGFPVPTSNNSSFIMGAYPSTPRSTNTPRSVVSRRSGLKVWLGSKLKSTNRNTIASTSGSAVVVVNHHDDDDDDSGVMRYEISQTQLGAFNLDQNMDEQVDYHIEDGDINSMNHQSSEIELSTFPSSVTRVHSINAPSSTIITSTTSSSCNYRSLVSTSSSSPSLFVPPKSSTFKASSPVTATTTTTTTATTTATATATATATTTTRASISSPHEMTTSVVTILSDSLSAEPVVSETSPSDMASAIDTSSPSIDAITDPSSPTHTAESVIHHIEPSSPDASSTIDLPDVTPKHKSKPSIPLLPLPLPSESDQSSSSSTSNPAPLSSVSSSVAASSLSSSKPKPIFSFSGPFSTSSSTTSLTNIPRNPIHRTYLYLIGAPPSRLGVHPTAYVAVRKLLFAALVFIIFATGFFSALVYFWLYHLHTELEAFYDDISYGLWALNLLTTSQIYYFWQPPQTTVIGNNQKNALVIKFSSTPAQE